MARRLLVRCKCEQTLEEAKVQLARLFNVEMSTRKTSFGVSFTFLSMGIDGAFYEMDIVSDVKDRRLVDFRYVLDLGIYVRLTGAMYSEIDALHEISLFVASFITRELRWPTFVCTEEDVVMDELST